MTAGSPRITDLLPLRLPGAVACWVLLLSCPTGATAASGPGLTPAEARGQQVYLSGTSPSGGSITAYLGAGEQPLELPGEAATCGSCHGHDGTGRPESGVLPSNITWARLTRSYGHLHADGLEHAAFDEASLRLYLRTGRYPGGRRGDASMPTYRIADADLDDLIAYLRRVGTIADPGLDEATIRIGTLLPAAGPLGPTGEVIRAVLEACFDEVNQGGGIYGRRLALAVHAVPEQDPAAPAALDAWLAETQPFALLSSFTPQMDSEVQASVAGQGIPVIGPFTLYAIRSFALNRNIFYLYAGLAEQLEALLRHADARLAPAKAQAALLYPADSPLAEVRATLQEFVRRLGWPALAEVPFASGGLDAAATVEDLRRRGTEVVVFLGVESELRALLTAAADADWPSQVLVPGPLAGSILFDAPAAFSERLFLSYPTLPQDREPWGLHALSRLLAGRELPKAHAQAAISAYSAAAVLLEGLRRAGRDLGRHGLVTELERLYEFETGLTPPITFTANRRVGAAGAYVLKPASLAEGQLPEKADWVALD